jgi:hypothetical protein
MESVHRHGGEVRAFIVAPVQPRERWQPSRPRPLRRISSSWPKSRARKRGLVGETTTTHPNVEFLGYSALAEVEIRFPELRALIASGVPSTPNSLIMASYSCCG